MKSDTEEEKKKVTDAINVIDQHIQKNLFQFDPKMGERWSRVRSDIFDRFMFMEQKKENERTLNEVLQSSRK